MLRLRVFALAACVLAVGAFFVHAQDDGLKTVLTKAIAAHGGEKNLAKFKAVSSKFKGTIDILGNKSNCTGESSFQKPDKIKNVLSLDLNGKQIDIVTVFDGKKMWVSAMGNSMEITDKKLLKEVREQLQTEGAGGLSDFLKAPYKLNALGEVKVKGKDAIGIRVSKEGQRDFSMFFDKKTHLIVKTEMRTLDGMTGQEVTQEKYILGYQDKGGIKVAKRVEIHKDGKSFMDIELTEVNAFERFDDSVFAKP
ncbi:MAG: hypothetical protein HYX68_05820 [Planctomycetes bacterium]|jgi:outer membrane lipoprotein-sorting protein|nr:hypothetical protein [Planctomycetota bacterium]